MTNIKIHAFKHANSNLNGIVHHNIKSTNMKHSNASILSSLPSLPLASLSPPIAPLHPLNFLLNTTSAGLEVFFTEKGCGGRSPQCENFYIN